MMTPHMTTIHVTLTVNRQILAVIGISGLKIVESFEYLHLLNTNPQNNIFTLTFVTHHKMPTIRRKKITGV